MNVIIIHNALLVLPRGRQVDGFPRGSSDKCLYFVMPSEKILAAQSFCFWHQTDDVSR